MSALCLVLLFYHILKIKATNETAMHQQTSSLSNTSNEQTQNSSNISDHCVVCMMDKPFPTLDEESFYSLFTFHCVHASTQICTNCWLQIFHSSNGNVRCPLCRKSKPTEQPLNTQSNARPLSSNNEPYGHTSPSYSYHGHSIQPGYSFNRNRIDDAFPHYLWCGDHSNESLVIRWCQGSSLVAAESYKHILCDLICLDCFNLPISLITGTIGIVAGITSCVVGIPISCFCCCDCCQQRHLTIPLIKKCDSFVNQLLEGWENIRLRCFCSAWIICAC